MWQCEYQSPVHDTSVKLQTVMELKQLKEGVTNANGRRIFIFPFWNPGVTFAKPTSQMPCYSKCMSYSWVWGGGKVYWLGSDSTISQDVQQHRFKSNNKLYVTKRTALYLDSLVLILFWRLRYCHQSIQISWCVGFRDQGSMYQALVSHFELFDNFVTIRILSLQKKCLV